MQPVCTRCLTPLPQHPVVACPVCGTPVVASQEPPEPQGSSNGKLLAGCGILGCLGLVVVGVLGVFFFGFLGMWSSSTPAGPVVVGPDPGGTFGAKRAAELPFGTGVRALHLPRVGSYGLQATYPLTAVGEMFRPAMIDGAISGYAGQGAVVSLTTISYASAQTASERVDAFYAVMVREYGETRVRRGNVLTADGREIGARMIVEETVTGPVSELHPCYGHVTCHSIYWSNGPIVMFVSGPPPHALSFHDAHSY
jgi:hypothetical protein